MAKFVRELIVKELVEKFDGAGAVFLVNYTGINAAQSIDIRKQLYEMGAGMDVVKNSLAKIALDKVGITGLDDLFNGPVAVIHGGEEAPALAKFIVKWIKDNRVMEINGGWTDGNILSAKEVVEFSKLPTKPELYSMIAGAVVGNISAIASCMNNLIGGVAAAVDAVREKKEEDAA